MDAMPGTMLSRMVCKSCTSPCGCHAFADGLQYRGPVNVTAKACRLCKTHMLSRPSCTGFPDCKEPRKHGTRANHSYTLNQCPTFPEAPPMGTSPDRH